MSALRIALAVLAVGLGVAFAWMTDWGHALLNAPEIATKKVIGKTETGTVLPDFKLGSDATAYPQIVERPLLNPTRKPAPTQPIVAVAPEPPKPQIRRGLYQLIGVTDLGSVKVAQVREVATRRVSSVRLGDALQELRVKKITPESVTLAFGSDEDVLSLAKFTPSGQVPQPSTPPPPPPQQPQPQPNPVVAMPNLPPGMQMPAPSPVAATAASAAPAAPAAAGVAVAPPAPEQPRRGVTSMRERLGIGRNLPPADVPPSPTPQ